SMTLSPRQDGSLSVLIPFLPLSRSALTVDDCCRLLARLSCSVRNSPRETLVPPILVVLSPDCLLGVSCVRTRNAGLRRARSRLWHTRQASSGMFSIRLHLCAF